METKEEKKQQIALNATPSEVKDFELIMTYYKRSSYSDMLRFMISEYKEKILSKNTHKGII